MAKRVTLWLILAILACWARIGSPVAGLLQEMSEVSGLPLLTSFEADLASDLTSDLVDLTSDLAIRPQDLAIRPQDLAIRPQDLTSG